MRNLRQREKEMLEQLHRKVSAKGYIAMVENQRTMSDYARPSLTRIETSIIRPDVAANSFEIKLNVIFL